MDDSAAIARVIDALSPWLGQLVIVGGWAHQLHRLHPLASQMPYAPLRTRDADVAFSPSDRLVGDIGAALRAADFAEDFSGDNTPPVAQYRLGNEDQGFYVEFLVPLVGDGTRRDGTPDVTLAKAGVTAQKLRHLDLLLTGPWHVGVEAGLGIPVSTPTQVMIANPVTFIAQKLLIQKYRKPEKRPQDVLYVHDTLELFAAELDGLRSLWKTQIRPTLPKRTVDRIEKLSAEQFSVVDDVIRNAARIPKDRRLSPEGVQTACAVGLGEVFGDL